MQHSEGLSLCLSYKSGNVCSISFSGFLDSFLLSHCSQSELMLIFIFLCSWICRLSKWVLRPGRELRLLPSGASIVTGPDTSWSTLRPLLGPHRHPSRGYGPPPAGPPPFQWRTTLLWYHVSPPRGLSQPRAWHPGALAQHLFWSVWP